MKNYFLSEIFRNYSLSTSFLYHIKRLGLRLRTKKYKSVNAYIMNEGEIKDYINIIQAYINNRPNYRNIVLNNILYKLKDFNARL